MIQARLMSSSTRFRRSHLHALQDIFADISKAVNYLQKVRFVSHLGGRSVAGSPTAFFQQRGPMRSVSWQQCDGYYMLSRISKRTQSPARSAYTCMIAWGRGPKADAGITFRGLR